MVGGSTNSSFASTSGTACPESIFGGVECRATSIRVEMPKLFSGYKNIHSANKVTYLISLFVIHNNFDKFLLVTFTKSGSDSFF
jgi:hypothetical protein